MQCPTLLRRLGLALLLLPLAGCVVPMTSSNTYMVPLSNGESMEMSISKGGLTMAESGGIHITEIALDPAADKKHVVYTFQLAVKNGVVPKHIVIQDLTEDPVRTVVDDPAPVVTAGKWKLITPALDPQEPGLEWLIQLDDTIRVYRLTITLADGSQVVMKQPQIFPVIMKQLIRVMTGIDKSGK